MNGNLVSALFGSLTSVVFFFLLLSVTRSRIFATSAALAYAFSATFWAQSIIVEVYSLAALLLFLCWYTLDRFVQPNRLTPVTASKQEREETLIQFIEKDPRPVFTIVSRFSPVSSYGL